MLVSGQVTNNTVSKFCPSRNFLIITAVENSWNVLHLLYSVDIQPQKHPFVLKDNSAQHFPASVFRIEQIICFDGKFPKRIQDKPHTWIHWRHAMLLLVNRRCFWSHQKTCHFSPIRMLRSWAKALYFEGNAVLAGSPAFPMTLHKPASLADSSLETLLIDFAHATTHKSPLSGYVQ